MREGREARSVAPRPVAKRAQEAERVPFAVNPLQILERISRGSPPVEDVAQGLKAARRVEAAGAGEAKLMPAGRPYHSQGLLPCFSA